MEANSNKHPNYDFYNSIFQSFLIVVTLVAMFSLFYYERNESRKLWRVEALLNEILNNELIKKDVPPDFLKGIMYKVGPYEYARDSILTKYGEISQISSIKILKEDVEKYLEREKNAAIYFSCILILSGSFLIWSLQIIKSGYKEFKPKKWLTQKELFFWVCILLIVIIVSGALLMFGIREKLMNIFC